MIASIAVPINTSGVNPSSATAASYEISPSTAPTMSWSSTESVSRTDPPPARIARRSTPGSASICSCSQISSRYGPITSGGTKRNG